MESSPIARVRVAEPLGTRRILLLIAASLWSVGTCVQLIRLIVAAIWLAHLRRHTREPQPQSQELLDRCREEIGLRRQVCLRIHSGAQAPVFIGGWRALVLVPADWEQLPTDARGAVLWHELAHAARRDDLAKLAEETIRAVFFFHPLVYWLLNRVDGYREQVCDAVAVRRGVAGRMLAQILIDFSRRNSAPRPRVVTIRAALPFFRRRTVKNRIRELLEDNTVAHWSAPLLRYQAVGLALMTISTAIALGGLGLQAADSPPASAQVVHDATLKSTSSPTLKAASATATTKTPAVSPTLERILANWKARQERTRSVYCSWESRMTPMQEAVDRISGKTPPKPGGANSHRFQFACWVEEPDRFRMNSAPLVVSEPTAAWFTVKTQLVIDGTTETRVEELGAAGGSPVCTIGTRGGQGPLFAMAPNNAPQNALALIVGPLGALVAGRRPFHVVTENALVDGLHCVQLRHGDDSSVWVENCWVDPARDDVLVAHEMHFRESRPELGGIGRNMWAISIQYQRDPVHGWVPTSWTRKQPGRLSEDTVTKFTINERFPEETFAVKLSPGTVIFDQRTLEQYRIARDGSKTGVAKFDSRVSLSIQKVLETKTDFGTAPEPLRDALDFIGQRYQIPIVFHRADFAAAAISTEIEVKAESEGIEVAALLKILLAQCPKPVGFRIEDEVLKISPRFAGQGPIRARPVPAPERLLSPTARKIQTALDSPIDVSIDPQSLREALDWIAARYQIPITLDASIKSTIEVKASVPGIRLRSLLAILFEQYPKPLEFKIEGDVLKIFPKAAALKSPPAKPATSRRK